MKKTSVSALVFLSAFILIHCDKSTTEQPPQPKSNPVPTLDSLSPPGKIDHMPSFILTANGSNFVSGAKIVFGGEEKSTNFVSSSQLTCQIEPNDITGPLMTALTNSQVSESRIDPVKVLVRNPSPGGGDSNSLEFKIWDIPSFSSPVQLTHARENSFSPDIHIDSSDTIHVVWAEGPLAGDIEIYYIRSSNYGTSWTPSKNLSNSTHRVDEPAVAGDGAGNVYVVWRDSVPGDVSQIYFTRSTNNGDSWETAYNLSNFVMDSYAPDIAVNSSGHVNVAWSDEPSLGGTDVYFTHSADRGVSWSLRKNISNSQVGSWEPAMVLESSGALHVVWEEYLPGGNPEIYYSRSSDYGQNWRQPVNVSNIPEGSFEPNIAVNTMGHVYSLWTQEIVASDIDIYGAGSTDNGFNWPTPIFFGPLINTPNDASDPALGLDGANNHNLVWADGSFPSSEIFYIRSTNGGADWGSIVVLSNPQEISLSPKIAVDNAGNPYVVYFVVNQTFTEAKVYFVKS